MRTKDYIGGFIVILGLLFLLSNYNITSFSYTWPIFILYVGLVFLFSFIKEKKYFGFIIPATVLITISLLFLYCNIKGWENMRYHLWPFFIVAPGAGFLLTHYFGIKNQALFISGTITVCVGVTFLGLINFDLLFVGVVFICLGLFFLFVKK
jgi:hypothetical protein